jgi:hypothetical protein
MLDAKDCPHRKAFTPAEDAQGKIMTCQLVNDFLGWMHGFPESFCERHCLAAISAFPQEFVPGIDDAMNYVARGALTSRLRDGRGDDDSTNPWRPGSWQHCSRDDAVRKAQACNMSGEAIANALVVAVERGLPGQEATELATRHALVT